MPDYRGSPPSRGPSSGAVAARDSPASQTHRSIEDPRSEPIPLDVYLLERGRPFVADELQLGAYYRTSGPIQQVSEKVGDYVAEELAIRGWEPTTFSAARVLEDLKLHLEDAQMLSGERKLEKIEAALDLLRAQRRLRSFAPRA